MLPVRRLKRRFIGTLKRARDFEADIGECEELVDKNGFVKISGVLTSPQNPTREHVGDNVCSPSITLLCFRGKVEMGLEFSNGETNFLANPYSGSKMT